MGDLQNRVSDFMILYRELAREVEDFDIYIYTSDEISTADKECVKNFLYHATQLSQDLTQYLKRAEMLKAEGRSIKKTAEVMEDSIGQDLFLASIDATEKADGMVKVLNAEKSSQTGLRSVLLNTLKNFS